MKNKRLAIFLVILVFFALIIVLSSAVFSLKEATVNFLSTTNVLTDTEQQIVDSANFKFGENVFFSSKKTYVQAIEKANPYIKVVNIETIFPNKFVVNAVERNENYVIKLSNNKYAITDESMKVLQIQSVFQNNSSNGIVVNNSGLQTQTVKEGDFFKTENSYMKDLFDCFREWDLSYSNIKAKIESIELNYNNDANRLLVNMRSGVQIIIRKSTTNLSDKLNLAFSFYDLNELEDGTPVDYTKSGIIEVFDTEEKIFASYRQAN